MLAEVANADSWQLRLALADRERKARVACLTATPATDIRSETPPRRGHLRTPAVEPWWSLIEIPRRGEPRPTLLVDRRRMRILPESRRASAALLLITVALAACALEFTLHVNASVQHFVVYWLYNGLVLAAGVVCIARGLASARERAAWVLIGAAVVSWGVGNTIWTFAYVDLPSPPYPSLADAFWLAVYPPVYVALLLLLRSRAGAVRAQRLARRRHRRPRRAAVAPRSCSRRCSTRPAARKAAIATNLAYPLADLTTDRARRVGARGLRLADRPNLGR